MTTEVTEVKPARVVQCKKLNDAGEVVDHGKQNDEVLRFGPPDPDKKPDPGELPDISASIHGGLYDTASGELSETVQEMVRKSMGVGKRAKIRLKKGFEGIKLASYNVQGGQFLAEVDGNFEAVISLKDRFDDGSDDYVSVLEKKLAQEEKGEDVEEDNEELCEYEWEKGRVIEEKQRIIQEREEKMLKEMREENMSYTKGVDLTECRYK